MCDRCHDRGWRNLTREEVKQKIETDPEFKDNWEAAREKVIADQKLKMSMGSPRIRALTQMCNVQQCRHSSYHMLSSTWSGDGA